MIIENAAVFVNGRRVYRNTNVEETDTEVIVRHRVNGSVIQTYPISEVGKQGMAWDSPDEDGNLSRIVVQQGCGCGGMKPYQNDPGYSGPFVRR